MSKLTGVKAVLADPKRLAKWKANSGLRSKLPDSVLTREQQLARRMGRPVFDGGPTGFEVAREARGQTDQVYGPQRVALQEEQRQVAAQRQRNAGWWDQYVGQLQAMQAPVANVQQSPDVGAQYGAPASQATQGVQQAAGGYQQALSSLAAGMLQNQVGVAGMRKLESLAGLDAQESGLKQKQGALEGEAARFRQGQKDKIKSDAWKQRLEEIAFLGKQADTAKDNARLDATAAAEIRNKEQTRIIARKRLLESQRAARSREEIARQRAAKKSKGKQDKPKPQYKEGGTNFKSPNPEERLAAGLTLVRSKRMPDPADKKGKGSVPADGAWARQYRANLKQDLVAKGLTPKMADRVIAEFIKNPVAGRSYGPFKVS